MARKAAAKPRPGKAAKPILLSGGNPQIAKGDGDAPVQAYIAAVPGWKRDVARRLDTLVTRTVPGVRKAVKWNSPFYGVEGQGWFLSFHCFTKYVKVVFFRGAALKPMPPGESKTENARYLDIYEDDEIDEKQFAAWVKQASRLPGWGEVSEARSLPMKKPKDDAKKAAGGDSPSRLIDAAIEALTDWRGETLARIRALIREADPEGVEEWKWGIPVWSHGGIICTGETYKAAVKTTFAKGAALADPSGLFNSSLGGGTRRAIDFREGDTINENAFKALVRAAGALNTSKPAAGARKKPKRG